LKKEIFKDENHILKNINRASTARNSERQLSKNQNLRYKNKKLSITSDFSTEKDLKIKEVKKRADRLFKQKQKVRKLTLKQKIFKLDYSTNLAMRSKLK